MQSSVGAQYHGDAFASWIGVLVATEVAGYDNPLMYTDGLHPCRCTCPYMFVSPCATSLDTQGHTGAGVLHLMPGRADDGQAGLQVNDLLFISYNQAVFLSDVRSCRSQAVLQMGDLSRLYLCYSYI